MKQALTVEQVAKQLQVHPTTIHKLIKTGQLKGIRVGRLWRVPMEALEEYLKNSSIGSSEVQK